MSDRWTCNANEATALRLVGAPPPCGRVFHPAFTYPIFGDAETIYGYQGLHIRLSFASGSLVPSLDVTYREKNTTTAAAVPDIAETLGEFLPVDDLVSASELDACVARDAQGSAWAGTTQAPQEAPTQKTAAPASAPASTAPFSPPGVHVAAYARAPPTLTTRPSLGSLFSARKRQAPPRERSFHIFRADWTTPGFRAWLSRAQIFTLFTIEGASYINEEEPNWEFYTVFERVPAPHGFSWHAVAYTSLYRFWSWQDRTRLRLSQFLVLPPYQGQGHGAQLYATVFAQALADAHICELTVEDPNEAFDRVRDRGDLARLQADPAVMSHIHIPVDRTWSEAARARCKMAPRQWARVVEMLQLQRLDAQDPAALRAYRLQVKARLYQVNREVLQQLPPAQQREKLQETFEAVVDEYAEVTGMDPAGDAFAQEEAAHAHGAETKRSDDHADDDEWEDVPSSAHKRARAAY
ncbi:histone acetyltransferase [Malassezia sp. CBS 17886]|nr:histone acetyltransferase [Malassezia sp. CBS 17886]